jgi:hypothetical protein
MTERVCGSCRWFARWPEKTYGACKRNPPSNLNGSRPFTEGTDRCGEWSDASITPEQEERQKLTRQFAQAMLAAGMPVDDTTWDEAARFAIAEHTMLWRLRGENRT